MNINIFRQGYEKPLHYPCTVLMKAKPGCSYDKRLYCDIFSLYYKCEKEWDMGDLKDKIEWWCYATDLERYIKQSQKDLEIATKALKDIMESGGDGYHIARKALKQIEHIADVSKMVGHKE